MGFSHEAVLYASLSFFTTLLHNTYLIFHIQYFLVVVGVELSSFWVVELIFLIWNSLNDPIFGFLSDQSILVNSVGATSGSIDRRLAILSVSVPALCLSFILFWIPLPIIAGSIQLLVSLCLYDTFLTIFELQHSSLLVDMAHQSNERADLNFYCAFFSCIGAACTFFSYTIWNSENPANFRLYCLVIAVTCAVGSYTILSILRKRRCGGYSKEYSAAVVVLTRQQCNNSSLSAPNIEKTSLHVLSNFFKKLSVRQNFVAFSVISLVQVTHCHFNSSFFPLVLDNLLDPQKKFLGPALLAASFVAPHATNLVLSKLCKRLGTYDVVWALFAVKCILPALLLVCGPQCINLLLPFFVCNRIFTEGLCKLLCLAQSDIIYEDAILSRRAAPLGALIAGTVNFISKPGQTLAPIIGTMLISSLSVQDSLPLSSAADPLSPDMQHRTSVLWFISVVPVVCGIVQIFIWSTFYNLKGKRLREIEDRLSAEALTVKSI